MSILNSESNWKSYDMEASIQYAFTQQKQTTLIGFQTTRWKHHPLGAEKK